MRFESVPIPALRIGACGVYRKEDIQPYLAGLHYKNKQGEDVYAYREDEKYVYVARALVEKWDKDARSLGVPVRFKSKFEPRDDRQRKVIRDCLNYDYENTSGYFLIASTGIGKSPMSLHIASQFNRKILVIVNKSDLIKQWHSETKKFLGLKDREIGEIRQKKYDVKGKKVVIALAQSLAKMEDGRYPVDIKTEFGVILFDEAQHLPADTFQIPFWNIAARYRIGITAGLVRGDDRTDLAEAHIGRIATKVEVDNMPAKVAVIHTGLDFSHVGGTSPTRMNGLFGHYAKSTYRNRLIVRNMKQAYDQGRAIIGLSALKDKHLRPLKNLLIEAGVPKKDIHYYTGGLSESQLAKAKKHGKIILATYKMAEEATDIPRLDTCFLLTPKSRPKQAIGRILRVFNGKKEPVVCDFVDKGNPFATGFFRARMKYYNERGWGVTHLTYDKEKNRMVVIK